jgi:nitrate/nitrite transporter NarK
MESALQMNSMICGILNMSGTLGSVIIPLVMAQHIEKYPIILVYASLVCSITCLIILVVIHISIALRQRKFKFEHFIENVKK